MICLPAVDSPQHAEVARRRVRMGGAAAEQIAHETVACRRLG